jgi:MFS family permease
VLIVVVCLLVLVSVPLAGGRLRLIADVEVRHGWTILTAIAVQVVVISLAPTALAGVGPELHLATYGLAATFLWANRHIPGLWLIGAGGCANFAAIAANGGVMPASLSALHAAGLVADKGDSFANSAAISSPKLPFLGDIFAIPHALPLSNVFSLGDVCIVLGMAIAIHSLCRSRLVPAGRGDFLVLVRQPTFMRVWIAQLVSNLGDFAYSLAVAVTVIERGDGAATLATVLIVQSLPAIVTSLLGGQLADRLSRRRLMVTADLLRAAAVGSLLLVSNPSTAHILVVAGCLGTFGALFQPALQASLPNLVGRELLVAANALVSATFHVAVLIGPLLGGLLAAKAGIHTAFAFNAASFLVSAGFLVSVTIPQAGRLATGPGVAAIREGMRHAFGTPLIRAIFIVTSIAMFAAALKQPLEPFFVLHRLGGTISDVGIAIAAWGIGMVLGSAAAPGLARRWSCERMVAVGLVGMGIGLAIASQATAVATLVLVWVFAGTSNGFLNVAYETLLQERTPDHIRGRVMAASDAVLDVALVAGLLIAGTVSVTLGVRGSFALAGVLVVCSAAVAARLLRSEARPAPLAHSARFMPTLVEAVMVGDLVLLRVAGEWRSAARGALREITLAVGDVFESPLDDPTASGVAEVGARPSKWRGAFGLSRRQFDADGGQLALVADGVRFALPPATVHRPEPKRAAADPSRPPLRLPGFAASSG